MKRIALEAAKQYAALHGEHPDALLKARMARRVPQDLVLYGVLLETRCLVLAPSRHKGKILVHTFGERSDGTFEGPQPLLCFDGSGEQLWIVGGNYSVGSRGIDG